METTNEDEDAPFMTSWDDAFIVTTRLQSALSSRGVSTPIASSTVSPLEGSGLSGDLSLLTLDTNKYVLKRTRAGVDAKKYSKRLGLQREGAFYETIGPWIQVRLDMIPTTSQSVHTFIPKALYAEHSDITGQKAIVLEYYDNATEAGRYFPHSVVTKNAMEYDGKINAKTITLEATRMAASFHGTFYLSPALLSSDLITPHLRMANWIQGKDKESFIASQSEVAGRWKRCKARWEKGSYYGGEVKLEKEFVDVMDKSCDEALDFDKFVSKWSVEKDGDGTAKQSTIDWSLVHGDFHPGNMLCLNNSSTNKPQLILIDWEVVGVGSGPQDIGQFLISHLEPSEAYDMIDEVTAVYRKSLLETLEAVNSKDNTNTAPTVVPTVKQMKHEIIFGGIERWVWLFGYMCDLEESMPSLYMQYFHDQMHGWIVRNGVNAENVGMPRP